MLTQEENVMLTRTGPGTPMGALLRRYWQPVGVAREFDTEPVRRVRILGVEYDVQCKVRFMPGFSAHADQTDLLAWHRGIRDVRQTFLVHGEAEVMDSFAKVLGSPSVQPALHESYSL